MDFFNTHVSPVAAELAAAALREQWLSEGPRVQQFEHALAKRLGVAHPVAVNSGTAALHLALVAAGVGPGDEVVVPAQTFVATGLVALMQKATPVFADIDLHTGNLSPGALADKVGERTRAVIPVHWGGYPCDLDEIAAVCDAHGGVTVIEDAAHALGAGYHGQPIGAVSPFTAFSFQAIKHITTGDGGALCCRDEGDERRVKALRWFGIDRQSSVASPLGERVYDIAECGYKYHMNDLAAAVGLGNLGDFDERLRRRRAHGERYRRELAGVAGITLLDCREDRKHAYWLFTLLAEGRDELIRCLADAGIPASVVHQRIDRNSVFGGLRDDLPQQERFDRLQVSIPVHDGLSDDDVEAVVGRIRMGW